MRVLVLISVALLSGCTFVAQYLGASGSTLQLAQTLDMAKITADAVTTLETGKPVLDHVTSKILDKDCNSLRLLQAKTICVDNKQSEIIQSLDY
jgi:hypothetical protein